MSPSTKRILARQRCLQVFRRANVTANFSGEWLVIDEIHACEPRPDDAFAQAMRNLAKACKNASSAVAGLSENLRPQP